MSHFFHQIKLEDGADHAKIYYASCGAEEEVGQLASLLF